MIVEKIKKLKEVLKRIDPSIELDVQTEVHDGSVSAMVFGPFPSFIFLLTDSVTENDRFLIHVNSDAANMVLYMSHVLANFPDMIHDGSFAIDGDTKKILLGQDAYNKKEENILMFARDIMARRRESQESALIMPEEKKIVLAS